MGMATAIVLPGTLGSPVRQVSSDLWQWWLWCLCHAVTSLVSLLVLNLCGSYNETICYNNGTCQNGSCACPYPYTGYDCLTEICECIPSMQCVLKGVVRRIAQRMHVLRVVCLWGQCVTCVQMVASNAWSCSGDPPCQNNGSCYLGRCSCSEVFTGEACETGKSLILSLSCFL